MDLGRRLFLKASTVAAITVATEPWWISLFRGSNKSTGVKPTIDLYFSPRDEFFQQYKKEISEGIESFFGSYGIGLTTSIVPEESATGTLEERAERYQDSFFYKQYDSLTNFGLFFEDIDDKDRRLKFENEYLRWSAVCRFIWCNTTRSDEIKEFGLSWPKDADRGLDISFSEKFNRIYDLIHSGKENAAIGKTLMENAETLYLDTPWNELIFIEGGPDIESYFYPKLGEICSQPYSSILDRAYVAAEALCEQGKGRVFDGTFFEIFQEMADEIFRKDMEKYFGKKFKKEETADPNLKVIGYVMFACHELGHLFGLWHSHFEREYDGYWAKNKSMYPAIHHELFHNFQDSVPEFVGPGIPNVMSFRRPAKPTSENPFGFGLNPYQVRVIKDYLMGPEGVTHALLRQDGFNTDRYWYHNQQFRDQVITGRL